MFQRYTATAAAVMALVVTSCLAVTPDEMRRAMPKEMEHLSLLKTPSGQKPAEHLV